MGIGRRMTCGIETWGSGKEAWRNLEQEMRETKY